jgi:hypothetical protein
MSVQFYADSDASGVIIGFYNDDLWDVAKIPATTIEITKEQWQDALENPRKYRIIDGAMAVRTQAEIDQEIADEEAERALNPTPESPEQKVSRLVAENVQTLDERTQGMQDIDEFTLGMTTTLEDRTQGMKDIDDYTLDLVFQQQTLIEELQQRLTALETTPTGG